MAWQAGTMLGPHEILRPLGAGGMGEVYLARDTRLEREVALKVLPPRLSRDPESITRFRREALALAALNHPNIATVYGFEELAGGMTILVLERIEGETLAQRLKAGTIPVRDALVIATQIAEALEASHEAGIIHRDLKPGNVMIGARGLVKVLDFGLARRIVGYREEGDLASSPAEPVVQLEMPAAAVLQPAATAAPADDDDPDDTPTMALEPLKYEPDEDGATMEAPVFDPEHTEGRTDTMAGMTVGTPGYMSPEQVLGGTLDERSDLFSLGCVLFECLTGKRAFRGPDVMATMRSALYSAPEFDWLPAEVSDRVRIVLARCMAKDREARPRSAREVRIELETELGIRRASGLRPGEGHAVPNNLPAAATSFVGRHAALAECERLLERTRVLTCVGSGGSGKTRLALKLAEQRLEAFHDGVWFVDIAPLSEPEQVLEALASAIGVAEEPHEPLLATVRRRLAHAHARIVLDNCETQQQACARLVADLLGMCPKLEVVLTSREPVHAPEESLYAVPPLTPPLPAVKRLADALASEAVVLFVERARAALPEFELHEADAPAVCELCRRLDGIPLAIELAATRVRALTPAQILEKLDERFPSLARRGETDDRHATVAAMIRWSWEQLLPPEQQIMARLAVFRGGWTLERATAVCSDEQDEFEMLDLLTRLVERSFVVVDRAAVGGTRYHFLESVAEFAQDRFAECSDADEVRMRHLQLYAALGKALGAKMAGAGSGVAIAEAHIEEANFIAAIHASALAPDPMTGARIALDVQRAWTSRGLYSRAARLFDGLLASDALRAPSLERGRLLMRRSSIWLAQGELARARAALEESAAIARAQGDVERLANALARLATVAYAEERFDDARALDREAEQSYRTLDQPRGIGICLHRLGTIDLLEGRPAEARARFESAIALLRRAGDVSAEALALAGLAVACLRLGERDLARAHLLSSLANAERSGSWHAALEALDAFGELMQAEGELAQSAQALGTAESARERAHERRMSADSRVTEQRREAIRAALGESAFSRAFDEGRARSVEDALVAAAERLGRA